jgi:hypothetical protein
MIASSLGIQQFHAYRPAFILSKGQDDHGTEIQAGFIEPIELISVDLAEVHPD